MKYSSTLAIAALAATALVPAESRASMIAEDPFAYAVGQSIEGQNSGTGWAGGWTVTTTTNGTNTHHVSTGLDQAGGAMNLGVSGADAGGPGSLVVRRDLATPVSSGVVWCSVLVRGNTVENGDFFINTTGQFETSVGKAWGSAFSLANDGSADNGSARTCIQGDIHLLLWKIDIDGGLTSLWVNPADQSSEVNLGTPDKTKTSTISPVDQVQINVQRYDVAPNYDFDDIKLGTELVDVANTIPTPGPPAPSPVSPADAATDALLDAQLQWTSISANEWDVYFWQDGDTPPTPGVDAPDVENTGTASFNPGALAPLTTYYWQVVASNPNGDTTGTVWSFTTSDGVVATAPSAGAGGVNLHATLEWSDIGATSWDVFVWKQSDPEPGSPTASGLGSPAYSPSVLDPQTAYNWKVVSNGSALGTTTSITWSFTTGDGAATVSPGDASSGFPLAGSLSWTDDGATSWDVYLWKDGESEPGTPTASGLTTMSYLPASLDPSATYNWKLVSNSAQGSSTSATWTFTTDDGLPGVLLLHEEFDGYTAGTIIGQTALGMGLDGTWTSNGNGDYQITAGISGDNALTSTAGQDNNLTIGHAVPGWGSGQLWTSFYYQETQYGGHMYVSGGGNFNGGAGHGWWNGVLLGLHNQANPGYSYASGEVVRIVTLIDWVAGTTTMWVNPTENPIAAGTPFDAQKVEVPDSNQVLFFTTYNTVGVFDDIRIGTKFDAVTREIVTEIDLEVDRVGTDLVFTWDSSVGTLYDLIASTSLDPGPADWTPMPGYAQIAADVSGTNTETVPLPVDPATFYAVRVSPPLLDESFDAAGPGLPTGWMAANGTGTVWDVGDPSGLPGLMDADGTNCVGTNVASDYGNVVETVSLTSPAVSIPAGGATLSFRQYIDSDLPNAEVGAIRLLDATDTEIVDGLFPVLDIDGVQAGWTDESYALPAAAADQNVKVVFEFTTNDDGTVYNGFYIDDVKVEAN